MQFKHIEATENWRKYQSKRASVVEIYNLASDLHFEESHLEQSSIEFPEYLHAFSIKGVSGGVLVEQLVNSANLAVITFAALAESERGKGQMKALLDYAANTLLERGVLLAGVQLNITDNRSFWNHIGFNEEIPKPNGTAFLLKDGAFPK